MRKKKSCIQFLLLLATIIVMGCKGGSVTAQLEQIDSLLVHDKVDSALNQLVNIPMKAIHNQEDSAFYFLLLTEAKYRKFGPNAPDSLFINYCTKYYKNSTDNEKLARAYYYKGIIGYKEGLNRKETIYLLKQAEDKANNTNNLLLKHKIYETLSHYNSAFYKKDLALLYAKKTLQIAKELNDNERIATAFLYLAGNYSYFGKMDSLAICIQQCLSLAEFITEKNKAYLYTRIGEFYAESEPEMAKKYLQKAIDIYPQLYTYLCLSNIHLKEHNVEEAQKLWSKALQMNESTKGKLEILKAMRQQSVEQKDFMQANALADSILKMQEQFYEGQRKDQIAEIQAKYDKETAVRDLREKYMTWGLGLLALTTIIVTFLGYKSRQGMKAKKELAESKIQLDAYTKKAAELESSGKASATEINKLHEKINELTHRHSGILAKGKELYDAIEAGGTTVRWTKDDFINCLEYYKMKDLPFVNEMETDYNRLSPKYIFFAILEHEGKSDEDIQRIMGISESTLRSTRSRINSKKR